MTFTYDASLGDEFGTRMFSAIIREYDEFLLDKYYERELVSDFAQRWRILPPTIWTLPPT